MAEDLKFNKQCPTVLRLLYLLGPSLVGEGNILSLFIAAVGQDVDDGDLIHTYEDTSCEVTQPYTLVLWVYKEGFKHFFFQPDCSLNWNTRTLRFVLFLFVSTLNSTCTSSLFFLTTSNLKPNWTSKISVLKKKKKKTNLFINCFLESTIGGAFVGFSSQMNNKDLEGF